jgi:hypothetical protein
MHRPSPATVISLAALVFAMSGTAYAATGGNFILGKANTATSVTSLANHKGTALSLSSASTAPPLKVSNSVQVPNLNASELGGQPASAYMTGTGQIAFDTATVASGSTTDVNLPASVSSDYGLSLECDSNGAARGVISATGATLDYWVLPPLGGRGFGALGVGQSVIFGATTNPDAAATWVLQVAFGSIMATTDWSATQNTSGTCTFAAQTISNG